MKRIITVALCLGLIVVIATGCVTVDITPALHGRSIVTGSGSPEVFTFSVGDITEVNIEMFCNVEYYATPSDVVTLEIQPNLIEFITVEESGGVLNVRSIIGLSIPSKGNPVLTLWAPNLSRISITGAGDFKAHDTISVDTFSFDMSGAGSGRAELDVRNLYVTIAGTGILTLQGVADTADFSMAGAGDIEALALQTRRSDINLAGVGSVKVSCSENISIVAGGVGTVEYRGSPRLDVSKGGLVTIRQVD